MKKATLFFLALVGFVAFATGAKAQVVPYNVEGAFVGNLSTLEAAGSATGLHFGRLDFEVVNVAIDPETVMTFDTQTASDGSQLMMVRVGFTFEITPAGDGLFNISGVDEWEIIGGNGRFANAKSSGAPIISTFFTPVPVDLSDPTAISAVFHKVGEIDLGKKRSGKK